MNRLTASLSPPAVRSEANTMRPPSGLTLGSRSWDWSSVSRSSLPSGSSMRYRFETPLSARPLKITLRPSRPQTGDTIDASSGH